ncbi:MAG: hypothetical protein QM730_22970 [Anaerolineales bacterium]
MYHTLVKRIIPALLITLLLSSCNGWIIQPLPSNPPTPFLPSTPLPSIYTQTPVIIGVASATSAPVNTDTPIPTNTDQPPVSFTFTPSTDASATSDPNGTPSVSVRVLGCNTSIDVSHGMGEVTNAFVILTNTGTIELTNLRVTLNALDEGREHPDKTVELTALPIGYQVTVKLTVDSTYQKDTPIQVATVSDQATFPIEGLASCTDLGLFAPKPEALNTPVPVSQ